MPRYTKRCNPFEISTTILMKILKTAVVFALAFAAITAATEPQSSSPSPASFNMKIITFYATATGESRFRELAVPFEVRRDDGLGHTLLLSNAYASPNVQFVELPEGMTQDWHNAPARQLVTVLSGVIEVETTDGQQRQWRAGEVFLPADITGRGHRTRCIGGAVRLLFAPLPEGFDLDRWSN